MAHISMYGKSNMTHRATRPSCDQKPRLSSSWISCKAASSCAQVGSISATLYLDTFKKNDQKTGCNLLTRGIQFDYHEIRISCW